MKKYGLKLWSTNTNYLKEAVRLYKEQEFDYIELFSVSDSFDEYSHYWQGLEIPFVIHAPHFRSGVNLAKKENRLRNIKLVGEAQKYADFLKADEIIIHPGIAGEINETVRQIYEINDKRLLVENKPYYALDDNLICIGASPDEIKYIIDNCQVGFCLDIGHSLCAARGLEKDPATMLNEFMSFNPVIFHITDGDMNSVYDNHWHIGWGNYDFIKILNILPADARLTVETDKDSRENLKDYEQDVNRLKKYEKH